ncbi:winged helix-turn-helix domain-containing protein [Granulosicoccus sp.]|nr:winged helix-turn-helix domain-containing protein [Granulosicoccus sp.]
MFKFNSCKGVAVISADSHLRARMVALLKNMDMDFLEFLSIEKFRQNAVRGYAVVVIQDVMTLDTLEKLKNMDSVERLVVASRSKKEHIIVTALLNGADFYFDITESNVVLAARLQAALRTRSEKIRPNIVAPPYEFDVQRRKVFLENRPISLSPMEYKLAEYLFSRPEKVVAKSELMLSVWSLPRQNDSRRVDTAACQIRRKMCLGSQPSGWVLQNIRKVGFRLSASTTALNVAG